METKSPYTVFKEWLYSSDENELGELIIKAINIKAILSLFGGHKNLTSYLNQYYNEWEIFSSDPRVFYLFLKDLIHRCNISRWDLTFSKTEKKSKSKNELRKYFPELKIYEINMLQKYIESLENLEINETYALNPLPKIKKLTKKEQKEISTLLEEKVESPKEETKKIETFQQLKGALIKNKKSRKKNIL